MPDQEMDEVRVPSGNDQLDLNLGEEEQGAEVEISEDGKAELREVSAEGASGQEEGQEHEEYSTRVKKRLDKMTAKLREAERREQAALEYARQVQNNLQASQAQTQSLDQGYVNEFKSRVESQLSIAEANLQDAIERNDGRAVVEAQKLLSQLVFEQQRVNQALASRQQRPPAQPVQQQYAPAPAPQRPQVDAKAEEWAEKNDWFGSDTVMTHAAFGIHAQLKEEGFDLSSDEYYDELNRRVRKEFPHKFRKQQANVQSTAPDVAPATRGPSSGVNGRRTIKLTPSEVAIARKLGVPLEEYAKHVRRAA